MPQRRWEKFGVGCWHSITPHTTIVTNHLQPRKRVPTKLWLATPSTLITTNMTPASKSAIPGTTAPSEDGSVINLITNENGADSGRRRECRPCCRRDCRRHRRHRCCAGPIKISCRWRSCKKTSAAHRCCCTRVRRIPPPRRQQGQWKKAATIAVMLFVIMPRPDGVTFSTVLSACKRSLQWNVALNVARAVVE